MYLLVPSDGHPIMVTASTAGHLAVWNLEERRLQAQMRDVHDGAIAAATFLTSEPILVTNGGDNTLKVRYRENRLQFGIETVN